MHTSCNWTVFNWHFCVKICTINFSLLVHERQIGNRADQSNLPMSSDSASSVGQFDFPIPSSWDNHPEPDCIMLSIMCCACHKQVVVPLLPYNTTRTLCHTFHTCSSTNLHLTAMELTSANFHCKQQVSCTMDAVEYGEDPWWPVWMLRCCVSVPLFVHSCSLPFRLSLFCALSSSRKCDCVRVQHLLMSERTGAVH